MPVSNDVPEPLKTALKNMEASVQSTKTKLAFAAPELHDEKWAELQRQLAGQIEILYKSLVEG